MPQNAGKHISESFKFQIFAGGAHPRTLRAMCCSATRRACYASTIHFSLLLSSDQTPITFSIDNPVEMNIIFFAGGVLFFSDMSYIYCFIFFRSHIVRHATYTYLPSVFTLWNKFIVIGLKRMYIENWYIFFYEFFHVILKCLQLLERVTYGCKITTPSGYIEELIRYLVTNMWVKTWQELHCRCNT